MCRQNTQPYSIPTVHSSIIRILQTPQIPNEFFSLPIHPFHHRPSTIRFDPPRRELEDRERSGKKRHGDSRSDRDREHRDHRDGRDPKQIQQQQPIPVASLDADEPLRDSSSDDDSDDEDDAAELMAELNRIKRQRLEEEQRREEEKRQEDERIRMENILSGNPLLQSSTTKDFKVSLRTKLDGRHSFRMGWLLYQFCENY